MAEPMYRQIAEDLRARIETGEIAPGEQLPTELELRDQYSASRNTIRDAIKFLATRGLVETKPGQGTFAVQLIDPIVTTLSQDPETGLGRRRGQGRVRRDHHAAPTKEAETRECLARQFRQSSSRTAASGVARRRDSRVGADDRGQIRLRSG